MYAKEEKMEPNIKKQWLISLITFHSVYYFGSIITRLADAYFRGYRYILAVLDLESVLLIQPLFAGLLGYAAYHYVYKLEKKYALKVVAFLTFLLTCNTAYLIHRTANSDWPYNYHIEIMIRQGLWFYASLFYFITSYRWYSRVIEYKSILKDLGFCFLGLASLLLSEYDDWFSKIAGCVLIGWMLLPDPDRALESIRSLFRSRTLTP